MLKWDSLEKCHVALLSLIFLVMIKLFEIVFCTINCVFNQLTMAINGPNEAPNTITTIKPSFTKFKGEKSQIFTPKILSCFSTRRKEKNPDYF